MKTTLIGGIASIALLMTAAPAAAYEVRYQDWSRVPDNSAGAVFHPDGDRFEVWDNVKDGVPVWVEWNYKGIRDRWKSLQTTKRNADTETFLMIEGEIEGLGDDGWTTFRSGEVAGATPEEKRRGGDQPVRPCSSAPLTAASSALMR